MTLNRYKYFFYVGLVLILFHYFKSLLLLSALLPLRTIYDHTAIYSLPPCSILSGLHMQIKREGELNFDIVIVSFQIFF